MQTGPMHAGGWVEIDLGAIVANWRALRERLGGTACAAVVKADACWLGGAIVAPALAAAGARQFFVAHLDEALAIRSLLPVDTLARQAGTIGHEILTSLGNRYSRSYAGAQIERLSA